MRLRCRYEKGVRGTLTEPLTITKTPTEDHQLDLTIQVGPERTEQALQRAARQLAKKRHGAGFSPRQGAVRDRAAHVWPRGAAERDRGRPGPGSLQGSARQREDRALRTGRPGRRRDGSADLQAARAAAARGRSGAITAACASKCRKSASVEGEVDEFLEQQRSQRATWTDIERAAEIGDTVVVDIKGTVGDDTIMDNQDWELILKEESGWLPGFDEAFVGMAAGDEKTFTLALSRRFAVALQGPGGHLRGHGQEGARQPDARADRRICGIAGRVREPRRSAHQARRTHGRRAQDRGGSEVQRRGHRGRDRAGNVQPIPRRWSTSNCTRCCTTWSTALSAYRLQAGRLSAAAGHHDRRTTPKPCGRRPRNGPSRGWCCSKLTEVEGIAATPEEIEAEAEQDPGCGRQPRASSSRCAQLLLLRRTAARCSSAT